MSQGQVRPPRPRNRALDVLWRAGAAQLAVGFLAVYVMLSLAFGVLYWQIGGVSAPASSSAASSGLGRCVYFSFVTQATIGYGDATPNSPATQLLVVLQSITGLMLSSTVPAILVVRLLAPSRRSIIFDPLMVFYPSDRQFRIRYVATSATIGRTGHWEARVRAPISDHARNTRNFRVTLANDGFLPSARTMVAYFARMAPVEPKPRTLDVSTYVTELHPAHVTPDVEVDVEVSFVFPFSTGWTNHKFEYEHIRCGAFVPMAPSASDELEWANLGKAETVPVDGAACTDCVFLDRCGIRDRVTAPVRLAP